MRQALAAGALGRPARWCERVYADVDRPVAGAAEMSYGAQLDYLAEPASRC